MGAPKGNEFWKMRSRHGVEKLFETPQLLWEEACRYFQWCIDNPLFVSEPIRSGEKVGKMIQVPKARPFTMHGLCLFLNCNTAYFRQFEANLKDSTKEDSKDFATIITDIKETIYQQKFEGATIGLFNANLISRDLGLQDNQNVNHNLLNNMPMPSIIVTHSGPALASSEDEVDDPTKV